MLLTIGRVLFAVLFIFAGADKLMDIPAATQMVAGKIVPTLPDVLAPYTSQLATAAGMPIERILAVLAGLLEVVGGIAIATSFGARFFAILLVFFIGAATYYFHDFWNMASGVERTTNLYNALKNLSLIGGLLMIAGTPRPMRGSDNDYTGGV